jgi:hypothetical protein
MDSLNKAVRGRWRVLHSLGHTSRKFLKKAAATVDADYGEISALMPPEDVRSKKTGSVLSCRNSS